MKEETIDIFIRTNQRKCKILSNQNSSRPLHQDAFTFTNFNHSNREYSPPKSPQNNNINAALKPHDKDDIIAMNMQDINFSSGIEVFWYPRSQILKL